MKTSLTAVFLCFGICLAGQPTAMDIPYGSNPLQKLDYTKASNPGSPILILVHGGGWAGGDKANSTFTYVAQLFKNEGYAVVSINYRLSNQPGYPGHPAIPSDVACAIAWTKLNAPLMNGDSARIFMYGQSAGGHLVMLHGLTRPSGLLSGCGYSAGLKVAGVIASNPALNFEHINPARHADIKPMVGDSTTNWKAAAPAHNLSNGNPTRFLIQIGLNDLFLGTQQAYVFRDAMSKYDYCRRFQFLPGHDHNSPLNNLSPTDPVFLSMTAFADSLFKEQLCANVTGKPQTISRSAIRIYPNPAHTQLFVEGAGEQTQISICDAFGIEKYAGPATPVIRLMHLEPGIYLVCVRDRYGVMQQKLILE